MTPSPKYETITAVDIQTCDTVFGGGAALAVVGVEVCCSLIQRRRIKESPYN
jgi:hypothetical protein